MSMKSSGTPSGGGRSRNTPKSGGGGRDSRAPRTPRTPASSGGPRGRTPGTANSKSSFLGVSPIASEEEREQALRDYKVTIEYKHLKSHAPGGVYLIPSFNDLRHFYGIIFVRRGPYTNGIFKFQLRLPFRYNDINMWPEIAFSSYVYNPYVNPNTGELDIKTAYPRWDPSRHYLVTVLTFLKKIFYAKNFNDAKANLEAKNLLLNDSGAFQKKVESSVRESQKEVFVNDPGCTARFTEEKLAHRVLQDLLKHNLGNSRSGASKHSILNMIEKASKV